MISKAQKGFSMMEVLITVFVMSVGMLGVTGMQLNSLKNNQNAYYRTQVNMLASDILDRMRSNMDEVRDGGAYDGLDTDDGAPADPGCSAVDGCTPAEIAALDAREWVQKIQNAGIIAEARGTVEIDANNNVTVTINWDENDYEQVEEDPLQGEENEENIGGRQVVNVKDLTITVRM